MSEFSPRDYAEMLTLKYQKSGRALTQEEITIECEEMKAVFPDLPEEVIQQYIELFNPIQKKRKRKQKRTKVTDYIESLLRVWGKDSLNTREVIIAVEVEHEFHIPFEKARKTVRRIIKNGYE